MTRETLSTMPQGLIVMQLVLSQTRLTESSGVSASANARRVALVVKGHRDACRVPETDYANAIEIEIEIATAVDL